MPIVPATTEAIAAAARDLRTGGIVAFPTETVYGLGADARNGQAVALIYQTKGRPSFNPLIVHVESTAAAARLGHFGPLADKLAAAFWPGPLTLVVPLRVDGGIASLVTAGLDTVAIRVPAHPIAQRLIAEAGCPIAAPSANRSGHVSPTLASHVADDFPAATFTILDGGPVRHGLESTIVDVTGAAPVLLRAGSLETEAITAACGRAVVRDTTQEDQPRAPGQLASHYAPRAAVVLDATSVEPGEALLAFGPSPLPASGPVENLSTRGDLIEAAARLFAALRRLDAQNPSRIRAMTVPDQGLGEAINDRLRRAAAPSTATRDEPANPDEVY